MNTELRLSVGSQYIHSPRFLDTGHTHVLGFVKVNGVFKEFDGFLVDEKNPFVRDLKMQYTLEEIQRNTEREEAFAKKKAELDQRMQDDEIREEGLRVLAKTKADALALTIFQDERHKETKRKIRRSESVFEVTALTAMAYMSEGGLQ